MYRVCLCLIALYGVCLPARMCAQKFDVMGLLPEKFDAYQAAEWLDYEGEALFDYINGGAELYLSYGLKGMTGCKYEGEGLPQVTVEVYEMTSAANAFGVYTQSRDREEHEFGQGSQRYRDFIVFWKDRYYVLVTTQRAVPESERALRHVAELVDGAIATTGLRPAIVDALPEKGLVPGGYLYFHHYVWLNAYVFIADYNIININEDTDAVLARYGSADARCHLLMVDYRSAEDAAGAWAKLKEAFAPESTDARAVVRMEDGSWFTAWTTGRRLCAIFDGRSREQIDDLFFSIK
jgi:hypothetical protein